MLKRSLKTLSYQFSALSIPKLVKVTVEMKGKLFTFQFPSNTKLAVNLEKARVPLDFECGFSCNCGTCSISLNESDFEQLLK